MLRNLFNRVRSVFLGLFYFLGRKLLQFCWPAKYIGHFSYHTVEHANPIMNY